MSRKLEEIFHPGEIEAQERYNGKTQRSERSVAAASAMYKQTIDEKTAFFIENLPFFFIATSDNDGNCDCSFRGSEQDQTGKQQLSVFVEDTRTVLFPDYSGNRKYNSLGNILQNPHIGLLFIDFPNATRLRINGMAEIIEDKSRYQLQWPTALRYIRVAVEQVFWNCSKRIPETV